MTVEEVEKVLERAEGEVERSRLAVRQMQDIIVLHVPTSLTKARLLALCAEVLGEEKEGEKHGVEFGFPA